MRPPNILAVSIVVTCTFARLLAAHQERYTSVEELGVWPDTFEKLFVNIESLIEAEEIRLEGLKKIKESLNSLRRARNDLEASANQSDSAKWRRAAARHSRTMLNPVSAFVLLSRIKRAMENIDRLLDDHEIIIEDQAREVTLSEIKTSIFDLEQELPLHEDLAGTGQALLRLQTFYNLNITKLIDGHLGSSQLRSHKMDAIDCFEMGKLAYGEGQYAPAVVWLFSALQLSSDDQNSTNDDNLSEETLCSILDYMAFAAYKMGFPGYAAKLTEAWLERDPDNERARENLLLYHEELVDIGANHTSREINEQSFEEKLIVVASDAMNKEDDTAYYQPDGQIEEYQVGDDATVKRLCLRSSMDTSSKRKPCELSRRAMQNDHFFPGLKVETLSENPKIVRIYDIISKREATYLRQLAKPKLQRSTIMSSKGLRPSDYRIAKTAWLRSDSDPVVERVERRLGSVLNLGMEGSELLQVVNYGLGGFYGPHMDSARASNLKRNDSVLVKQLDRSDRLATVLIYLSKVEAGGATVFPRLNLTVKSIERSAVVWFNILDNGYSDERTLHTGCPVLLGTKWIATKWPHEEANSFKRPCKIVIDDKYK